MISTVARLAVHEVVLVSSGDYALEHFNKILRFQTQSCIKTGLLVVVDVVLLNNRFVLENKTNDDTA